MYDLKNSVFQSGANVQGMSFEPVILPGVYTGSAIKAICSRIVSQSLSSLTNQVRLVAGGIRLAKISKSDQESGVITVVNQPKGFVTSSGATWAQVLERNDKQRLKVYAA